MSLKIVSQFQSSTFVHKYPTLQRDFSTIAELLVVICKSHSTSSKTISATDTQFKVRCSISMFTVFYAPQRQIFVVEMISCEACRVYFFTV